MPPGPLHQVDVEPRPLFVLDPIIGGERGDRLGRLATEARTLLEGRTIWNINSTAAGGGVAEMLHTILGYVRGAAVDSRWLVIEGTPDFFTLTKRLHTRLHGVPGTPGPLGAHERRA